MLSLPHAHLKGSHREGPDVSVSLALTVKYLPSGLWRENVQPGQAQPLCKMLIPSLLFPALRPERPPPPRLWVRVSLPGPPYERRAPGSHPCKANEQPIRNQLVFFFFLSQGTSGFKPDNMLFQFYFSLNATKFHVYL